MEKETSSLNRIAVIGLTLVILILAFSLYYVFYVSSQKAYFVRKSHRLLTGIGRQVTSRVEGLRSVVEKASKGCKGQEAKEPDAFRVDLTALFSVIRPFGSALKLEPDVVEVENDPKLAKPVISIQFRQDGRGNNWALNYACGPGGEFQPGKFVVASDPQELLGPLLRRFVRDDRRAGVEDLFDKVLVVESETGKVVFAYGDPALTITNIGHLLAGEADPSAKPANESSAGEGDQKGQRGDEQAWRGGSVLISRRISDTDYQVFLQPTQLTVPRLDHPTEPGVQLTICGLVRSSHLADKTYSIPYTLLLWFLYLVLATILSAPLVKLKLMGPKDQLSRSDVVLTACSVFLGTALVILVILDTYTYIKIERECDDQLTLLSSTVARNLRSELTCASDQLDALNRLEKLHTPVTDGNELDGSAETDSLAESAETRRRRLADIEYAAEIARYALPEMICPPQPGTAREHDGTTAVKETREYIDKILTTPIVNADTASYPYFNSANWIVRNGPEEGQQRIKFTTRRVHTPFISVKDREYFINAKDGLLWEPGAERGGPAWPDLSPYFPSLYRLEVLKRETDDRPRKIPLYVQSINSLTSGENVAVLSKLTPNRTYVSAMDTRLQSLYQPVLPRGFEFCVIDSDGRVLFHCDDAKNLEENLFEESNNDSVLRSAVQSRARAFVSLSYLGRQRRALSVPLQDLPWTLVVFRDKQILRTINLEIMTLSAIVFGSYTVLLMLALGFVFLFLPKSKDRRVQLWPTPECRDSYYSIAVINTALFLVSLPFLAFLGSGTLLIVLALVSPAASVTLSVLALTGKLKLPSVTNYAVFAVPGWRRSYTLALTSGLAVLCVIPATVFFKVLCDEETRVFVRLGQMSLARKLESRADQISRQYSSQHQESLIEVGETPSDEDRFINKRLASSWDVYDSFFFVTQRRTSEEVAKSEPWEPIAWFMTTFSPFYDEICIESVHLVRGKSSDEFWIAGEDEGRLSLVLKPSQPRAGREPYARLLISSMPAFIIWAGWPAWLLLATLAATLFASYFLVRFAARKLLLLDMPTTNIPTLGNRANYLVLSPPSFDGQERLSGAQIVHVRLNTGDDDHRPARFVRSGGPCPQIDRARRLFVRNGLKRYWRIDLSIIDTDNQWRRETRLKDTPPELGILIDNFEYKMDDPAWNARKLRFLERLLREKRRVVIVSAADPAMFHRTNGGDDGKAPTNGAKAAQKSSGKNGDSGSVAESNWDDGRARWARVLAEFTRVDTFDTAEVRSFAKVFSALNVGRKPLRYIESLAPRLPADLEPGQIVAEIGDQARSYHQSLWSGCSKSEQLTLYYLAQHGLVSPRDPDVRPLIQRGLITREPSLRVMDESFRQFVLTRCADKDPTAYRSDLASTWERFRIPLTLILVGLVAFLFITQKELYDSTFTLISALTGGVITLFKLVGMFRGKGSTETGG